MEKLLVTSVIIVIIGLAALGAGIVAMEYDAPQSQPPAEVRIINAPNPAMEDRVKVLERDVKQLKDWAEKFGGRMR